jgi:type I restriction enzyme M protein
VFEDEIKRLAEEFGDEKTAFEMASKDHKLVRFFIPKQTAWPEIRKKTTGIGEKLTDATRAIAKENPVNPIPATHAILPRRRRNT